MDYLSGTLCVIADILVKVKYNILEFDLSPPVEQHPNSIFSQASRNLVTLKVPCTVKYFYFIV